MRKIAAALLAMMSVCVLTFGASAQSNPAPASWQGSRTSGHAVIFRNSGQGVTLQDGGAIYDVRALGAIADGASHPLSGRYTTLAQAQVVCPEATSLSQEIDWCAMQSGLDQAATLPPISGEQGQGVSSGLEIRLPSGSQLYTGTSSLTVNNAAVTISGGDEMGSAILVGTSGNSWLQFGLNNAMAPQTVTVINGGTGCANGNTLTLVGGSTPGGSPVATVLTVTNAVAGVIQAGGVSITTPGSYGTPPNDPVSVTGTGGCTGATFSLGNFSHRGGSLTMHDLHILAATPNAYFVQAQTNLNFRSLFWRNMKFDYTGNNNFAKLGDFMGLTNPLFQNLDIVNNIGTIDNNTVAFVFREQTNMLGHYEHRWDHVIVSGGWQTGWDYKLTDSPGFQGLRWDHCAFGQGGTGWLLENTSPGPTSYVSIEIARSFIQSAQFLSITHGLGVRLIGDDVSVGTNRLTVQPPSVDLLYLNDVRQIQILNNIFSTAVTTIPVVTAVHFVGSHSTVASNNIFGNAAGVATYTAYSADSASDGIGEGSDLWLSANLTPVIDAAPFGKNVWSATGTTGHLLVWGQSTSSTYPAQLGFPVDGGSNPIASAQGAARWYASPQSATANLSPATGKLFFVPIYFANRALVKNVGFNIQTASAAGWHARLGIYTDGGNPATGTVASIPLSLVPNTDTGDQSYTNASTGSITVPVNGGTGVTLSPGWYWLGFTTTGDATLKTTSATTSTGWLNNEVLGAASAAGAITGFTPAVSISFAYTGVESLPTGSLGVMTYNAVGAPVLAATVSAP